MAIKLLLHSRENDRLCELSYIIRLRERVIGTCTTIRSSFSNDGVYV